MFNETAAHPVVAVEEPQQRRKSLPSSPLPQYPDTHRSPYAPGPIRTAADELRARIDAFVKLNPEFSCAAIDVIAQYMDRRSGYRTDDELAERALLSDEGVDVDWHEDEDYDFSRNSDDCR